MAALPWQSVQAKLSSPSLRLASALPRSIAAFEFRAGGVDRDRCAVGEIVQIDRHHAVLVGLHQPHGPCRGFGMAGDELFHAQNLVEPRLPLRHRRRPGLKRLFRLAVAGVAGKADRAFQPPKLLCLVDRPHAGIFNSVKIIAFFDRRRTLGRIVERGLEHRRGFQRLQERDHVADFLIVKHAVAAPRRHYRFGIIDARIIDIVEQPLVLAPCIADFRQIGSGVAGQVGVTGLTHNMAGETRAAAVTVGHQLGALGRIARDRATELARRRGCRRRGQIRERVEFRTRRARASQDSASTVAPKRHP